MRVQQVPPHEYSLSGDGRPIAMLALEPDELAARYGLAFEEGYDTLDYFERAAIALADGSQVWLMRHRGNPVAGTIIYADAAADPSRVRGLLAHALGLDEADFLWTAPSSEAPAAST